ncbi:hypothetical protein, partial [Streptococcus anginosus]|uniref:hypothetical protein n=1 Tax=Streptococcus anginosus TaxID=1328 RepID=UPI002ED83F73
KRVRPCCNKHEVCAHFYFSSAVECLPRKHKALGSVPTSDKKKKEKKKKNKQEVFLKGTSALGSRLISHTGAVEFDPSSN